jgi:hypothetical protein
VDLCIWRTTQPTVYKAHFRAYCNKFSFASFATSTGYGPTHPLVLRVCSSGSTTCVCVLPFSLLRCTRSTLVLVSAVTAGCFTRFFHATLLRLFSFAVVATPVGSTPSGYCSGSYRCRRLQLGGYIFGYDLPSLASSVQIRLAVTTSAVTGGYWRLLTCLGSLESSRRPLHGCSVCYHV